MAHLFSVLYGLLLGSLRFAGGLVQASQPPPLVDRGAKNIDCVDAALAAPARPQDWI